MTSGYDPDRMNSGDVDPNDPAAVDAWLNHPNTKALHSDLGRAFRAEPAEVQRPVLQSALVRAEENLRQVTDAIAARAQDPAEVKQALQELREATEDEIASIKLRLLELDD